jgi:hypothetical protein
MLPLDLSGLGRAGIDLAYVVTGFCFGFVLEQAGFGNARNLAAQFYLRDMRVLKVMFTAIVTAMLLLFGADVMGLLKPGALYINPTHLWPGIVGGIVFGVGFVIGGYCPGTSIVSLATLKLDGLCFVVGMVLGMVCFGETVSRFRAFFETSGNLGELTLAQVFGVPQGLVVVLVVAMALGMFWAAERIEAYFATR